MVLQEDMLAELKPSIHRIIKKQLGFSEETLLSESLTSLQHGADKDELTRRLDKTIMDRSKASKLSDKIHNAVDEYLLSRDLPDLKASVNRKRPQQDQIDPDTLDGVPMIKKSKPETEETGNGNGAAAPAVPMTPAQIRAMMANTMKQIEDRKASIAAMQGKAGLQASKVSLPPPKLVNVESPSITPMESIAALQARINRNMEKMVGPIAPPPEKMTEIEAAGPGPGMMDRPSALILDDKGRAVDAAGQQITLTQHVPTLKANLRAKKREEVVSKDKEFAAQQSFEDQAKFFDGRVAIKGASRQPRASFNFVEPGQYQREGQRVRMKAQLERLQAEISTISRKTGITSAIQLAKLVPKSDTKSSEPDVEWWDALIMTNGHSSQYTIEEVRQDAITNLVEHPIQLKPLESAANEHIPVFLTKKEQKKIRRQNRREAWKEKQDQIRLGILQPDQAKVKISNMMRVLESDAIQDPTKVEAHVRAQMAKRLANHEKANLDRKLTPEQRKQKSMRKLKEDTTAGVNVVVFRVRNLNNPAKKFKVETNAKQLFMTGCTVLYEDVNVVVVEGGPKQAKKYKQLMLKRIKWEEETLKDREGLDINNQCVLVWEGETKERQFGDMKFKQCPSENFAREFFKTAGVEHYWDLAYSGAVLENSEAAM